MAVLAQTVRELGSSRHFATDILAMIALAQEVRQIDFSRANIKRLTMVVLVQPVCGLNSSQAIIGQ